MSKRYYWGLVALLFHFSCTIPQTRISPPPPQIERIEGYASLRIESGDESARSKFSFLFQLPDRGRIDVSSFLGKTVYQIVIDNQTAFLLIPSKKVYWQGKEEEIVEKILGFRLNLDELISLMTGEWKVAEEKPWQRGWILEQDEGGRIQAGQRVELGFEVIEFFPNTSVVRLLTFEHPLNRGRLKILAINFNQPLKEGVFSRQFLNRYQKKSWAEIEEMLDEKN